MAVSLREGQVIQSGWEFSTLKPLRNIQEKVSESSLTNDSGAEESILTGERAGVVSF